MPLGSPWKLCVIVVQSPSRVRLFESPWTAACQASLFLTISRSLPKFMFVALMMLSSRLILSCPLLLLPLVFPSIRIPLGPGQIQTVDFSLSLSLTSEGSLETIYARLGRSPGVGNGNPPQYFCHGHSNLMAYSSWGHKE